MSGERGSTPLRMAAAFVGLAASLLSAGCVSTTAPGPLKSIGSAAPTERTLPPDIKQILAAGGLNANDPSAPAPRPTAIASAEVETQPASDLVEVAANPPSRQIVMAARSPVAPEARPSLPASPSPEAKPAVDLLIAAVPKPKSPEEGQRIEQHVSSYAPMVIEGSGRPPIRLADINMDEDKPRARSKAQARGQTPRPAPRTMTAARSEAPKVRRF